MTTTVEHPPSALTAATTRHGGRRGAGRVDLCGLDYGDRRRRLFSALRDLDPGEQLHLISDRADDVLWLRYEVEARIAERYFWSLPDEGLETARFTVRRLRPAPAASWSPPTATDTA